MSEGKLFLEKSLGTLLGFEDGALDVLEHLLTIESRDDLVEYLTQLLGEISPEISQFVENIGRYTRGEHLIQDVEESKILKISATQSPPPISASVTTLEGIAITHAAPSKHVSAQNNGRTQKQQSKSRVPPPKSKLMTTVVPSDPSEIRTSTGGSIDRELVASRLSSESVSGEREKADKPVDKKLTPKKGKATKVCGCYGTLHKPLTNCLYCGRISCVEEGYDYCPFCGFMVEDIRDGKDHSNDPHWERKERLLRFDREFARRTKILDDQADYQGPSTWMNDDERAFAEENQSKQRDALKRPKQVMNLAL